MGFREHKRRAIGPELSRVCTRQPAWWRKPAPLRLNMSLIFVFLLSAANGYDGSIDERPTSIATMAEIHDHPTWVNFFPDMQFETDEWLEALGSECECGSSLGAFALYRSWHVVQPIRTQKTVVRSGTSGWCSSLLYKQQLHPATFVMAASAFGGVSAFFSACPLLIDGRLHTQPTEVSSLHFSTAVVMSLSCGLLGRTFGTRNYGPCWT